MDTLPYPKDKVIAACRALIVHILSQREENREKLIQSYMRPPSIWNWWKGTTREEAESAAHDDYNWLFGVQAYGEERLENARMIVVALENTEVSEVFMTYGEFSNISKFYACN